ncbi:MAG: SpoIIE family protein phosphatase [Bacteroidia bacterium]|nr:SpoIIE family protein phosphatase [Bacteroidia bacterium]
MSEQIPDQDTENGLAELERLRSENAAQKKEIERLGIFLAELETTNNHLVSATWREREMKKQLTKTLGDLRDAQQLVEAQHHRIAESINYARRIQQAINVSEDELRAAFPESFVIYQPKDAISGDFPWFFRNGDYAWVAAVDCTGHGVPGAMLSMIGNLLLHDIINSGGSPLPGQILEQLHHGIIKTLKQDAPGANSSDGMDAALCRIHLGSGELVFAGSHRPLLLQANGETELIAGDKYPIGGMHYKNRLPYINHTFTLARGDRFLLYSDGYTDQFGGESNKRITNKGIKAVLDDNNAASMSEIKALLENTFNSWKGSNKQIDDVVVIGISY